VCSRKCFHRKRPSPPHESPSTGSYSLHRAPGAAAGGNRLTFRNLPPLSFPNGAVLAGRHVDYERRRAAAGADLVVVHANWLKGSEARHGPVATSQEVNVVKGPDIIIISRSRLHCPLLTVQLAAGDIHGLLQEYGICLRMRSARLRFSSQAHRCCGTCGSEACLRHMHRSRSASGFEHA